MLTIVSKFTNNFVKQKNEKKEINKARESYDSSRTGPKQDIMESFESMRTSIKTEENEISFDFENDKKDHLMDIHSRTSTSSTNKTLRNTKVLAFNELFGLRH